MNPNYSNPNYTKLASRSALQSLSALLILLIFGAYSIAGNSNAAKSQQNNAVARFSSGNYSRTISDRLTDPNLNPANTIECDFEAMPAGQSLTGFEGTVNDGIGKPWGSYGSSLLTNEFVGFNPVPCMGSSNLPDWAPADTQSYDYCLEIAPHVTGTIPDTAETKCGIHTDIGVWSTQYVVYAFQDQLCGVADVLDLPGSPHDGAYLVQQRVYAEQAYAPSGNVIRPAGAQGDVSIVVKASVIYPSDCDNTPPPPPPGAGGDFFDDVPPWHTFYEDIDWLADAGITKGCNPPLNNLFCPDSYVTRGQMAAFLARALSLPTPPASAGIEFIDDNDSIFEADIEKLAYAEITRGCNPPTNNKFCPNSYVTRGQMAAFLARALKLVAPPASANIEFIDDNDSIFEADIEKLAYAGITKGCNPPTNNKFCPNSYVTRGQMAAFLHRAWQYDYFDL